MLTMYKITGFRWTNGIEERIWDQAEFVGTFKSWMQVQRFINSLEHAEFLNNYVGPFDKKNLELVFKVNFGSVSHFYLIYNDDRYSKYDYGEYYKDFYDDRKWIDDKTWIDDKGELYEADNEIENAFSDWLFGSPQAMVNHYFPLINYNYTSKVSVNNNWFVGAFR